MACRWGGFLSFSDTTDVSPFRFTKRNTFAPGGNALQRASASVCGEAEPEGPAPNCVRRRAVPRLNGSDRRPKAGSNSYGRSERESRPKRLLWRRGVFFAGNTTCWSERPDVFVVYAFFFGFRCRQGLMIWFLFQLNDEATRQICRYGFGTLNSAANVQEISGQQRCFCR